MSHFPPHKRNQGTTTSTPTPSPNPPPQSHSFSFRGLSLSSPRGCPRGASACHPRPNDKIIHAAGCVSRWSPLPPFTPDGEMLRLEPFPCGPIERKTGAKPLALVASSPGQGSSERVEDAAAAIAKRFLPDLLAAAERAKAGDAPKEQEAVKLSLVARVGKVLFQCQPGGLPVSLDMLREAAKAGEDGTKSQLHKSFYTSVPSKCLDDMERSAVFDKKSIGERFSIVGVWHTNYKTFRNETLRLKLRHADRFYHRSSNGEVANEVTFKLFGMSRRLEDGDQDENSLKEMLKSAVQIVWDNAPNYKIVA